MIVISSGLVITLAAAGTSNQPQVGYNNLVTATNLSADQADANFPVTNLANPATSNHWLATSAIEQVVTSAITDVDAVDYVAIAGHNFGTEQIAVSIDGDNGGGFVRIVGPTIPTDDRPLVLRFAADFLISIRIHLAAGNGAPRAAVVYVGKLLGLERNIYVGHTPFPFGRVTNVTNEMSESGQFLGRIIVGSQVESKVAMQNITPAWYRSDLDPFIRAARSVPFFFAWRPTSYPDEVGYAAMTNDPHPMNQRSNGMMSIDWEMVGVG